MAKEINLGSVIGPQDHREKKVKRATKAIRDHRGRQGRLGQQQQTA